MDDKYIYIRAVLPSKKPNKDGELPIMVRVTYDRKKYFKALGYKTKPESFSESDLLTNKVPNFEYKNRHIRKAMSEIERALHELRDEDRLSPAEIKKVLTGGSTDPDEITLDDLLLKVKREYSGVLSDVTLNGFNSVVGKVNAFHKSKTLVSDITPLFLTRFEGFLRKRIVNKNKTGQAETTTWSDMKELRSIFNKGLKIKAITNYPFSEYSVPKFIQPKRNYLSLDEVAKIEAYADDERRPAPLRKAAAWFVFSCYSSLRYSDLVVFKETWIKNGKMYFSDQKEATPHFIPVHPKLQASIVRLREHGPVMQNQPFNRFLKEVMIICEIDTNLTVHLARHTFAVTWLDLGGTKDVLQKLMGHKRLTTTEIYGQITNKRIEEEATGVFAKLK